MTILYHYVTWRGTKVHEAGVIKPSSRYLPQGPPLVWLTENENWEPSIQSVATDSSYIRGPPRPYTNSELGIPCWKFEVEVARIYMLHYTVPGWVTMLEDAISLGSDISQWRWSTKEVKIKKSYKWINNWEIVE